MGFTLQGLGPFLHWMTLGALCVFPVLAAVVIYKLGSLPGSIARSRGHPQADAINICGCGFQGAFSRPSISSPT